VSCFGYFENFLDELANTVFSLFVDILRLKLIIIFQVRSRKESRGGVNLTTLAPNDAAKGGTKAEL
jgi:hypothetical protein